MLGAVIVARIVWVFPSIYLPRWLVPRIRVQDPAPRWQATFVLSWAGLRGVISLAAAAALSSDVPQRNLLVFLTFTTVLGTLLVQGLTLPRLIRWLGVRAGPDERPGRRGGPGRRAAGRVRGGAAAAGRTGRPGPRPGRPPRWWSGCVGWPNTGRRGPGSGAGRPARRGRPGWQRGEAPSAAFRRLRREMTTAERAEFIRLRDERQIDDEVLDEVLHHLDLEEAMLSRDEWDAAGRDTTPAPGTPVTGLSPLSAGGRASPARRAESRVCDSLPRTSPPMT